MKDFFLTPRGDLSIENIIDSKERLEINFVTSKTNALRLNFFVEDTYSKPLSKTSLAINFKIDIPKEDKEFRIVSGNLATEQAIKIRLLTSLGSLKGNEDIGSTLETIIHSFVDSNSTFIALEKIIKQAIKDIVPNATVTIIKPNTKYIDYSNSLKVTIVDEDKKYNIQL